MGRSTALSCVCSFAVPARSTDVAFVCELNNRIEMWSLCLFFFVRSRPSPSRTHSPPAGLSETSGSSAKKRSFSHLLSPAQGWCHTEVNTVHVRVRRRHLRSLGVRSTPCQKRRPLTYVARRTHYTDYTVYIVVRWLEIFSGCSDKIHPVTYVWQSTNISPAARTRCTWYI